MSDHNELHHATEAVLERKEVEGVLSCGFYTSQIPALVPGDTARGSPKPTHYKVICISLYNDDLRRLDAMVDSLKARGMTKANRSALIRYALGEVDLEAVPRGM